MFVCFSQLYYSRQLLEIHHSILNKTTDMTSPTDELTSSMVLISDDEMQVIHHYLLWNASLDEDWTIEAVFGQAVQEEFRSKDYFEGPNAVSTVLYRMEHRIPASESRADGASRQENVYHIRITNRTSGAQRPIDDTNRRMINPQVHSQFLFDVPAAAKGRSRFDAESLHLPGFVST